MLRFAFLASTLLAFGCASTQTNSIVAADSSNPFVVTAPNADFLSAPAAAPTESVDAESSAAPASAADPIAEYFADPAASAPAPVQDEKMQHTSRFTVKAGWYSSEEDGLDDGWIVNLSWMNFMSKIFAMEFELGYLDADGEESGVNTDLWAMPVMLNGRLNVPIWILDLYGGLGIGVLYYDVETDAGPSDDGFLFAGNAFLGATANVGDSMSLGLEAKYYVTDDISEFDEGLDALAVMLTLGFAR